MAKIKETAEVAKEAKAVKKSKAKKPGFFKRIGTKIKDVFSELKKVNWPTFSKVLKKTGVVVLVVAIFLVVLTAIDFGLLQLLKIITG